MTPQGEKSYLKTTKKGNVTINPRKEDLMSESLRKLIQSNLADLKEDGTTYKDNASAIFLDF